MAKQTESDPQQGDVHDQGIPSYSEKQESSIEQHEHAIDSHGNLVYENAEEEPELHARTYLVSRLMGRRVIRTKWSPHGVSPYLYLILYLRQVANPFPLDFRLWHPCFCSISCRCVLS